MEIRIPDYVRSVLEKLTARGYEAYLVGGCVRDVFLGQVPNDWDITTSALPEEMLDLFPDALTIGLKHGTVTVKSSHHLVEVTTFRTDGKYADHRHPESVRFVSDVNEDLARRDFTINAMALSKDGVLTDPFSGQQDLEKKCVRCVRNSDERFSEDALRMFRAHRFCAKLGFFMEEETSRAISRNASLALTLSAERIRDELSKILLTDCCERLYNVIDDGLMEKYIEKNLPDPTALSPIAALPKELLPRWSMFILLLSNNGCIRSPMEFGRNLRLDNRTVRISDACCAMCSSPPPESSYQWKCLLNTYGEEAVSCGALLWDALNPSRAADALAGVLSSGECYKLAQLRIRGKDLQELALKGEEIGKELSVLLKDVLAHPEHNDPSVLLSLAASHAQSKGVNSH